MTGDPDLGERLRALREDQIELDDLYSLIHDFGEAHFISAEPDVARFLEHPDPQIRYVAVHVIAFDWGMLKYRGALEGMLVGDPDGFVRQIAASGLGHLLRESRDARVIRLLLQTLRRDDEDGSVREAAYEALLDVWLPSSKPLDKLEGMQNRLAQTSRIVERSLALSKELGQAQLSGDSEKAFAISEELRILGQAWEESWQEHVDWGAVAAIERGEVPEQ